MTVCARVDCPNEGTHHPVLLAMPAHHPDYTGAPVDLVMGIVVCAAHQAVTTAADLVTDEGWATICAAFDAVHMAAPDRATLGLVWERPGAIPAAIRGGGIMVR